MNAEDQRKLLSALCHGSIFFSSFLISVGIPFAILFASEDTVVRANAKEALNFHINLYIYAVICIILISVFIGIPLLIILGLTSFIMPCLGIVSVINHPNQPYRYPFIYRFF